MKGDLQHRLSTVAATAGFLAWGANQSSPVLELASASQNFSAHLKVQPENGYAFVASAREIGEYLAHVHGIGISH